MAAIDPLLLEQDRSNLRFLVTELTASLAKQALRVIRIMLMTPRPTVNALHIVEPDNASGYLTKGRNLRYLNPCFLASRSADVVSPDNR